MTFNETTFGFNSLPQHYVEIDSLGNNVTDWPALLFAVKGGEFRVYKKAFTFTIQNKRYFSSEHEQDLTGWKVFLFPEVDDVEGLLSFQF